MAFDNVSAPRWQPKKPGDTLTPQYIARRTAIEEADGGGQVVELGLSRNDQVRFGVDWVILDRSDDEPPIELHQNLIVTVRSAEFQNWTRKRAFVVEGDADIVRYTPKYLTRVDGISLPDCRNLHKQFGPDFRVRIAADPSILTKTRYSTEKQAIIIRACQRELTSEAKSSAADREIVNKLCACGVTKAKARRLAENYDPDSSPYQFFFRGGLSFLQADRVARLIDPERRVADRPFLFIIDQFVDAKHVIISQREIQDTIWINFGAGYSDTEAALNRLIDLEVVRKIEKKTAAVGEAITVEIGERVVLFDRETKRAGAISAWQNSQASQSKSISTMVNVSASTQSICARRR